MTATTLERFIDNRGFLDSTMGAIIKRLGAERVKLEDQVYNEFVAKIKEVDPGHEFTKGSVEIQSHPSGMNVWIDIKTGVRAYVHEEREVMEDAIRLRTRYRISVDDLTPEFSQTVDPLGI